MNPSTLADESQPTVVITASGPATTTLIGDCVRVLCPGGLLFVYGSPRHLPSWGVQLARHLSFKYWIALDIAAGPRGDFLQPAHQGLLVYWKTKRYQSYPLNARAVRVPHEYCSACRRTLKDWGGKKHLMNPAGTALADVWRDLPRRVLNGSELPADVAQRLHTLAGDYLLVTA